MLYTYTRAHMYTYMHIGPQHMYVYTQTYIGPDYMHIFWGAGGQNGQTYTKISRFGACPGRVLFCLYACSRT